MAKLYPSDSLIRKMEAKVKNAREARDAQFDAEFFRKQQLKKVPQLGIKVRVKAVYMSDGEEAALKVFININENEFNGSYGIENFNNWIQEFKKEKASKNILGREKDGR